MGNMNFYEVISRKHEYSSSEVMNICEITSWELRDVMET